jgi:hypothetical protein
MLPSIGSGFEEGETIMTRTVLGVAALCLAASGAVAQTTYDWSGSTTGADQSRDFAITPEHVVVLMQSDYADIAMEDAQAPLQGAGGPCFGKAEFRGGAAEGDGYCLWRDPEGDLAISRWTATGMTEAGVITGSWETIGGSGKWAGASGAGAWERSQAEPRGPVELRFTGEGTLP